MSYNAIIERVFLDRYRAGDVEVGFVREDLIDAAAALGVPVPRNLGDVLYTFRYRRPLPKPVVETAPEDKEWTIRGAGQAAYTFRLVSVNRVVPNPSLMTIKIPDATPEIVSAHAMSDEQALLAKIRYNRLLDVFLGVSAYSLQNHLRTTVERIGQIEVDEIYVAVDSTGRQFVLPVQAKRGSDQLSVVQSEQDLLWCRDRLPDLICRPILTQFADDDLIAMFEVAMDDGEIKVVQERHYRLVPASDVNPRRSSAISQLRLGRNRFLRAAVRLVRDRRRPSADAATYLSVTYAILVERCERQHAAWTASTSSRRDGCPSRQDSQHRPYDITCATARKRRTAQPPTSTRGTPVGPPPLTVWRRRRAPGSACILLPVQKRPPMYRNRSRLRPTSAITRQIDLFPLPNDQRSKDPCRHPVRAQQCLRQRAPEQGQGTAASAPGRRSSARRCPAHRTRRRAWRAGA